MLAKVPTNNSFTDAAGMNRRVTVVTRAELTVARSPIVG